MEIVSPLPRMPEPPKANTRPIEKVVLTKGTVVSDPPGVIVQLSPEVQWMMKKGIL